jgi:hypothetical protein
LHFCTANLQKERKHKDHFAENFTHPNGNSNFPATEILRHGVEKTFSSRGKKSNAPSTGTAMT